MSHLKLSTIKELTPEQLEYVQKLYEQAYIKCFNWTNQDKSKDSKEINPNVR